MSRALPFLSTVIICHFLSKSHALFFNIIPLCFIAFLKRHVYSTVCLQTRTDASPFVAILPQHASTFCSNRPANQASTNEDTRWYKPDLWTKIITGELISSKIIIIFIKLSFTSITSRKSTFFNHSISNSSFSEHAQCISGPARYTQFCFLLHTQNCQSAKEQLKYTTFISTIDYWHSLSFYCTIIFAANALLNSFHFLNLVTLFNLATFCSRCSDIHVALCHIYTLYNDHVGMRRHLFGNSVYRTNGYR